MRTDVAFSLDDDMSDDLNDDGRAREVLSLVRDAIMRTLRSQKAAAIEMGVNDALLSRQLNGQERLSVSQLAKSPAVLAEFGALLAEHVGHRVKRCDAREQAQREIRMLSRRLAELLNKVNDEGERA